MESGFRAWALVFNTFVCTASGGALGIFAADGDWPKVYALAASVVGSFGCLLYSLRKV